MNRIIKQIETKKCGNCGTHAAVFLVKDNLCPDCQRKKENTNVSTTTKI